jgi:hypothetical protein
LFRSPKGSRWDAKLAYVLGGGDKSILTNCSVILDEEGCADIAFSTIVVVEKAVLP